MTPSFFTQIGLGHYLVLGCLLFAVGLATTLSRREPLRVWMGIMLVMAAAAIEFAAFDRFVVPAAAAGRGEGGTVALLIVAVIAVEAVAAAAVFWNLAAVTGSADLDRASRLAG